MVYLKRNNSSAEAIRRDPLCSCDDLGFGCLSDQWLMSDNKIIICLEGLLKRWKITAGLRRKGSEQEIVHFSQL